MKLPLLQQGDFDEHCSDERFVGNFSKKTNHAAPYDEENWCLVDETEAKP